MSAFVASINRGFQIGGKPDFHLWVVMHFSHAKNYEPWGVYNNAPIWFNMVKPEGFIIEVHMEESKRFSIGLSASLYAWLKQQADKNHRSMSGQVNDFLEQMKEAKEKQQQQKTA
ncbi:MAG: hypothetical protein R3E93_08740 [Thiothrix sp.]